MTGNERVPKEILPLEHGLGVVAPEFPELPKIALVRGLALSFRFISTSYLDLTEDVGALVLAVIGEVNVEFSFGFSRSFFIR